MNPTDTRIPETPICRIAGDETQPCPFGKICGTTRQRIQSGYHWIRDPEQPPVRLEGTPEKGAWFQRQDPMWGNACCHYGHLATASGTAHLLRDVVAPDGEAA